MASHGVVSLGIAGALGPEAAARIAPAAERAGFHALWINDTPGGDSLAAMEAAASVTDSLRLGTGVIALDRRSASEIAADVAARGLPTDRLTIGIGSGQTGRGALALVRSGADDLRGAGLRVMVGALGPRMRAVAVTHAAGTLLNWLTPETAAVQAAQLRAASSSTAVVLYARTAMDAAADERLDEETARYASYPSYAANFARLGISAADTVVRAPGIAARVAAYRAHVDELVLRAITRTDDVADYLRFIDDAAAELALRADG
ncbi:LLM class flavin-dependent oxidoreductase [Microbacterium sp. CJ88]|uniref:LLM class flavin-dependent oxidoreductase n=1 Tax=Microbacterium sp. CJ88 TaxID=3445672 RepID=UPI003F656B48